MIAIDMEMPSCCFGNNPCPLADGETGTCNKLKFQEDCDTTEKRPSNCPLIEIEQSESKVIESFKTKINSYDKDYSFSREEVLNILERYEIHCTKQSEDCVSRKEMIKEIQEWKDTEFVKMTNPYYYLEKRLSNLPPVTPMHKTYKDVKAFSNELKQRMKERDEDNGGEPLNAVDRGYHLAFEHLCEESDNLLADFERRK